MATRQEAIQRFEQKLTELIDRFIENMAQDADEEAFYQQLGWVGGDLPRLMSKAAMATWEASADVQDYMKANVD